ncbi:MAG: BamA/TamA family outer membrane protein [Planctomycetota bacterium]
MRPSPSLSPSLLALALLAASSAARADPPVTQEARLRLKLDVEQGRVRGEGTLTVRNTSQAPWPRVPLVLYPARFRELDPEITDLNFDRYYARWFSRGDARLRRLEDEQGHPLETRPAAGVPDGVGVWVELGAPLAPGATRTLSLAFEVQLPKRLGTFGRDRDRIVADGGLLPYVPEPLRVPPPPGKDPDWDLFASPARATFDLELEAGPDHPLLLADRTLLPRGAGRARFAGFAPFFAAGDYALLVDLPGDAATPSIRVVGAEGDDERARRVARVARQASDALRAHLPEGAPRGELLLVQAPLRDRFAEVADGAVLYSDRLFRVFPLLAPFHELELGRAVIQALVRQRLEELELGADRDWVCEGLAWLVARDWGSGRKGLKGHHIRKGMEVLSFIPVIDGLVRAPRFTGSDLFFGRFYEPQDAVPDAFPRALSRRARGRVVAEKLRDKLGDERLWELADGLLGRGPQATGEPGRERVEARIAKALGADPAPFLALWLSGGGLRAPRQDLKLDGIETLRELPDGGRELRIRLRREGDPRIGQVGDPVSVAAVSSSGAANVGRWDGKGDEGEVVLTHYGGWLRPLVVDPEERIDQTSRGDDVYPQVPVKLLLNRLNVRVDLNRGNRNEAAIGGTIIPWNDYSNQFTVDAFYQQDERGLTLGYGHGFGWSIDQRTYGLGLGGEFTAARLTQGVLRKQSLLQETKGDLISLGIGTSIDTRIFAADPSWGVAAGFHYEYGDRSLGGDFRFHRFDASLTLAWSPIRGTTLSMEMLAGDMLGNRQPTQRLFDAGGAAVRGVKSSLFVDSALLAVHGELRQFLLTDLDVNLLWAFYVRKLQLVLFVDSGDTGDSIDDVFHARTKWKWGTGFGFRVWGDSFGLTRMIIRFDVGFRIDETNDLGPQYYLGVGQNF